MDSRYMGEGSVGRTAVSRPQFISLPKDGILSPSRLSSVAIDNFCKYILLLKNFFYRICQVKVYEIISGSEFFGSNLS